MTEAFSVLVNFFEQNNFKKTARIFQEELRRIFDLIKNLIFFRTKLERHKFQKFECRFLSKAFKLTKNKKI